MNAENSPRVPAVGPHLLPEAGRNAGVLDGQLVLRQPLVAVLGRQRLLARRDQVLLRRRLVLRPLARFSGHLRFLFVCFHHVNFTQIIKIFKFRQIYL